MAALAGTLGLGRKKGSEHLAALLRETLDLSKILSCEEKGLALGAALFLFAKAKEICFQLFRATDPGSANRIGAALA